MSLAFQCISGVSNKHNLENSTLSDKREKVKKTTWFSVSSDVYTEKKKFYVSCIWHAVSGNNKSDRLT